MNMNYQEAIIMKTLNATKNRRHSIRRQVLITQIENAEDEKKYIDRMMFDKYKKYRDVFFTLLGGQFEDTDFEDSDSEDDTNLLLNKPNPRNEEEYDAGNRPERLYSNEFMNRLYQKYNETEDKEERYPQLNDVLDDITKDKYNIERLSKLITDLDEQLEQTYTTN